MGHKDGGRQYAHRLFWPGDGAQAGETQWFCLSGIEAGVSPNNSGMQSTGVVLGHRELPLELKLQC